MTNVTVRTVGRPGVRQLSAGGKTWHSTWTLDTSQTYTVTATGTGTGGQQDHHDEHVPHPDARPRPSAPRSSRATGQTYGVGMPIMLTFSQPITNKAAVERSLELTTSKPVVGAWYWDGDEQLYFRPRDYWPANTTVSFDGHLNGVEGAKGVYGTADLTQTFDIGRSLIAVASTTTHLTQIYLNGKLHLQVADQHRPGQPAHPGRHLPERGEGQPGADDRRRRARQPRLLQRAGQLRGPVHLQRRLLPLGPLVGGDQGTTNVSHGCVNLPPTDAQTYYNLSIPGDPITVTNSTAAGKWDDGWTEWFLPWSQYLQGQRARQGRAGRPARQHVRQPVLAARRHRHRSARQTSAAGNYYAGAPSLG